MTTSFSTKGFTARMSAGANKARQMMLMVLSIALMILSIALSTPASAQTTTLPGVTSSSANPTVTGITVGGWNGSELKAWGLTPGGDGKGTVQAMADGFFKTTADAKLATNLQGSCTIDCQYTLSTLRTQGEAITASRAVNQGYGTSTNPVMAVANNSGNFMASSYIQYVYTPVPASPAPAPGPAKP